MLPIGGVAEAGFDWAGLDDDYVDAEAFHFESQRVAERFDCVLGCVIVRAAGERELAAHRA